MSTGRQLPTGDDGRPDARLVAALADDDGSPAARSEVWAALVTARVFVPLATQRTAATFSESDMALVMLGSASGARALPAFTDGHEVQRWRAEARPVPVPGPQACRMALDDGAQALVLDLAGPALVVRDADLVELAAGRVPVAGTGLSTRLARDALGGGPADLSTGLIEALGRALTGESQVRSARVLQGAEGPVVGLVLADDVDPASLAGLAERVRARLGDALPAGGLDLAAVDPHGPGQPVPLVRQVPGDRPSRVPWRRRR